MPVGAPNWEKLRATLLPILVSALVACAAGPVLVYHSFAFDAVADSPDAEVLDYAYGESNAPGARMPDWIKREVGVSAGTNTNGPMPVGDRLYVKWRLRSSGEVMEDTVDLKNRLPQDMSMRTVYFVVAQRQLHVYVVSPEPRPPGYPIKGPGKFQRFKVDAIYPARPSEP